MSSVYSAGDSWHCWTSSFSQPKKKTGVGHKNFSFLRNSADKWSKNISITRSLTEMASLVQVSMMGCSRLSNSVMSNWVSTNNFWVCCSIAKAMAAVTCSYMGKGHNKMQIHIIKIGFHVTGCTTSFFPTSEAMSAQGDKATVSALLALLNFTLRNREGFFFPYFPFLVFVQEL